MAELAQVDEVRRTDVWIDFLRPDKGALFEGRYKVEVERERDRSVGAEADGSNSDASESSSTTDGGLFGSWRRGRKASVSVDAERERGRGSQSPRTRERASGPAGRAGTSRLGTMALALSGVRDDAAAPPELLSPRGASSLSLSMTAAPDTLCAHCAMAPATTTVTHGTKTASLCTPCSAALPGSSVPAAPSSTSLAPPAGGSSSSSSSSGSRPTSGAGERARSASRSASVGTLEKREKEMSMADFELLAVLGVGGFGKVFLARLRESEEVLAVKQMSVRAIEEGGNRRRVETEQEIMRVARKAGGDPWLVRLFYAFEDVTHLCFAMEYVPGGDLRMLLDAFETLEEESARFYFSEAVQCVRSIHRLGYIHRDLKPANFLIDSFGHLKLADFGLSKLAGLPVDSRQSRIASKLSAQSSARRKQVAYSIVGTPNYMASDMLTGRGYDQSVDWWSLGCILYEMLAGLPPFSGNSADEVFSQIREVTESLGSHRVNGIPEGAAAVVLCLVCEPDARLSDDGFNALRELEWLRGVAWDELREQEPPFIPDLSSETDTTYFDAEQLVT